MRFTYAIAATMVVVFVLSWMAAPEQTSQSFANETVASADVDKESVDRTRKTIMMLDGVYKQAIVLITDKYVHDVDDFPAGSAAVVLFENVSKGGTHQVRLIDATGEPYEPENVAKDDFEREGIKQLKEGASHHEEVVEVDGKHQLRVLTPVPVVMDKCIMCHDHYADAKEGEPIGAISYMMPIE